MKTDNQTKGDLGEKLFKEWLDESNIGYIHISQDKNKFPSLFKNKNVKRPDFLVLIDSIGFIAVDVKNYTPRDNCYTLSEDREVKPVLNFEMLFRIPTWYAYCDEQDGCWYWISALKAISEGIGERKTNKKDKSKFLMFDKSELIKIEGNNDLGKLYTQRLNNSELILQVN